VEGFDRKQGPKSEKGDKMPTTHDGFWDCECESHYIHNKCDRLTCPKCGAEAETQPDSRVNEITKIANHFTDDDTTRATVYRLAVQMDLTDLQIVRAFGQKMGTTGEVLVLYYVPERESVALDISAIPASVASSSDIVWLTDDGNILVEDAAQASALVARTWGEDAITWEPGWPKQ
jgi:hypothetical protein